MKNTPFVVGIVGSAIMLAMWIASPTPPQPRTRSDAKSGSTDETKQVAGGKTRLEPHAPVRSRILPSPEHQRRVYDATAARMEAAENEFRSKDTPATRQAADRLAERRAEYERRHKAIE
jgi:hypothetical protein